ncbi:hypothetical protein UNH65_30000 [Chitinophaga sp. 180180018-2]|nr:hypothetical protein [Chitinophaga sp. 212800010-3]
MNTCVSILDKHIGWIIRGVNEMFHVEHFLFLDLNVSRGTLIITGQKYPLLRLHKFGMIMSADSSW